MFKYNCLNAISEAGLKSLSSDFVKTDDVNEAEAILVRSAAMHDMEFSDNLLAVARAGAGVNNIPLDKCAEKGIVVFNTPGANANGVKELVIAAMILTSRNLIAANGWVNENKDDENIGKTMEKAKSKFAGREVKGKKLGVIGLGAIGVLVANAASSLGMEVIGCDPFLSVQNALNLSRKVKLVKEREEVFRECDYITVHVPLLDDTKEMALAVKNVPVEEVTLEISFDGKAYEKQVSFTAKAGRWVGVKNGMFVNHNNEIKNENQGDGFVTVDYIRYRCIDNGQLD